MTLRKTEYAVMLVGTPPRIVSRNAYGFDGQIDNLVIESRTPAEEPNAANALPQPIPAMAEPEWAR
ncbi:MAG: hypothetical protein JXR37_28515 [Kiritimatiellae bacterium]|nr:hypothetical protein [Kiritimatiellia bacterium]